MSDQVTPSPPPPTQAPSQPEIGEPPQPGPTPDTYERPPHGWTCFHCGETFKTTGGAADHFGAKPTATPGCLVRVQLGDERGLEMALRKAEEERDAALEALRVAQAPSQPRDDFSTCRPPMTRIAGVSPCVLERAARAAQPAPAPVDERQAFEKWINAPVSAEEDPAAWLAGYATEAAWQAWKARAALCAPGEPCSVTEDGRCAALQTEPQWRSKTSEPNEQNGVVGIPEEAGKP
jgi:hypothetical protein